MEEKKITTSTEDVKETSVTEAAAAETEQKENENKKENLFIARLKKGFKTFGKTIWRWTKRTFMGASKELADADKFSVERIDSPGKALVKSFFRKPLAVIATCLLVGMFLVVLIGPLAIPMDLGYEESYHVNQAPGYKYLSIPSALKKNVKSISTTSYFSVGIDNNGKLYVWGNTKVPNSPNKTNFAKIPEEVKNSKIAFAAAGFDHIIAITEDGRVIGWGENDGGQYGESGSLQGTSLVLKMPDKLLHGTINVSDVKQLVCGYQVSAIVMKNGSCYVWGNYKSGASNMSELRSRRDVERIEFLGTKCVALLKDGSVWFGNASGSFDTIEVEKDGSIELVNIYDYINGRKVVDMATTKAAVALLLEDGELVITGQIDVTSKYSVKKPVLSDGEKIVDVAGGARHFTLLTSTGKVYSFGNNFLKQCKTPKGTFENGKLAVGSFQNYIIKDGKVVSKWGLSGYAMGTDNLGRDVFTRIVHGGKMTMTIGAVAVIISTIIAIIIGCASGYFGGWVDMLLMRITEIFSSIPFLPFALILSAVLAGSNIKENTRIFMIMCILGVLSWTGLARMIRGQVLAEREKEFVTAAKAMGVKEGRIAFKHILPNVVSVILVSVTLDFAGCMLTESSLSYLGFGVTAPRPTWGNMLNGCNNETVIGQYWWRWVFPSMFLLLTTVAINIIGDTLRDVMDPKSDAEK